MNAMLKRFMLFGSSLSMGVSTGLRWRKAPQVDNQASGKTPEEDRELPPASQPTTVATLRGTVIRSGERFALRVADGALYPLDSTGRAWPFEGEDVQVTGNLEGATQMIHIVAIESVDDAQTGSLMTA